MAVIMYTSRIYRKIVICLCLVMMMCFKGYSSNEKRIMFPDREKANVLQSDVKILVTTNDRFYDLSVMGVDYNDSNLKNIQTIVLDSTKKYQTIDGFGAAITGSTAFNMSLMPAEKRYSFIKETFSPGNFGFSYVRVPIGCSDFSLSEYTCCDVPGIENFALTSEENEYVIPVLKQILSVNPSLKIIATPWTCPRWMKIKELDKRIPHNSWTGGHLNPLYYWDYAQYFVKWIKAFNKEGIPIYSITPQNEPLNRGNSASLYMGWEEERDFVKKTLGPALKVAGLGDVKIYAFDHNYNYDNIESQKKYPLRIYQDNEASRYLAGAAYHNYGGNRSELLSIHDSQPDKELIFTEASIGKWNNGRNLKVSLLRDMEDLGLGTVNNWCRASIVWNLMLDNDRGPYGSEGACETCYGAVDVDNETYSQIIRNSHYYVMAHMASVVKPGAIKIKAGGYSRNGLTYAAFKNIDNSYALVLCNNNSKNLNLTINDASHNFSYLVPGNSIVSFLWNKINR